MVPAEDSDDTALRFLRDGLLRSPSPVLLLALEPDDAASVAISLYQRADEFVELLPEPRGRLIELTADSVGGMDEEECQSLGQELVDGEHWLYVADLPVRASDAGPTPFLSTVVDLVAEGRLPAVFFAVSHDRLDEVRGHNFRLAGFAHVLDRDEAGNLQLTAPSRSVAREALDRNDTGWLVAVRFDLEAPVSDPNGDFKPVARVQEAGTLVEGFNFVKLSGPDPIGAFVNLLSSAFTISQEEASFAAAAAAAELLIGRDLGPAERLLATRGLYYYG